ncbi:MAG: helix-turn-helix transcriptional regulator [Bacteroidota bacterium]
MKESKLGEFEELVLLTVAALYDEAYGLAIQKSLSERLARQVSLGALHAALRRMEGKGFVQSRLGEQTPQRGGKRKRFFRMTLYGYRALQQVRTTREALWDDIPPLALEF